MFERFKARRAERAAAAAARAAEATGRQEKHVLDLYDWTISRARSIADGSFADAESRLALKKGERAIYCLDGVGLVESRKGPGHWQGRSQGVSVHVPGTKSMRYRVGQTKGTFVIGEEKPTVVDTGSVTVTTTRAVFVGSKETREWTWAKLIAIQDDDPSWIGIAVSNRQKVSGVSLPTAENRLPLQLALDMAVALTNDAATEYVAEARESSRTGIAARLEQRDSVSAGLFSGGCAELGPSCGAVRALRRRARALHPGTRPRAPRGRQALRRFPRARACRRP